MAIENTVSRLNRTLSDTSIVFNVEVINKYTALKEKDVVIIECLDEKNQERLIEQLLIAGFKLV